MFRKIKRQKPRSEARMSKNTIARLSPDIVYELYGLIMLLHLYQYLSCHILQRLEDAGACHGNRLKVRDMLRIKELVHTLYGGNARQVPLIILDRARKLVKVIALFCEVDPEVIETFHVRLHPLYLTVGNEYDTVNASQDELPACGIEDLSGNGIKMEPYLEASDIAECEGEKVEKECPFGLCGKGNEFPLLIRVHLLVNKLQIRRLAAQAGPVIDDLAIDLS